MFFQAKRELDKHGMVFLRTLWKQIQPTILPEAISIMKGKKFFMTTKPTTTSKTIISSSSIIKQERICF
jgi:hypothetical protein